ncbi:MAG TPA: sulfite exporter TauE/SafE family protein [Coxiellaceae bacterium]|nr:MAG: hypothetical protein A3E81_00705 [Gammaproteobacteria bacterium RIFCSPHIGHO2_12_FULL_36_30]HLB56679.1 sulfite exporter TauE/SafE family protein [Coxiellaceae bacterium]
MLWEPLLFALLIYFILGICTGFLSGLLGVGGGLIMVPGLVLVFPWEHINPAIMMHVAVGTSLTSMIIVTYRSLRSHMKYHEPFFPIYKKLLPAILVGIIVGGLITRHLDSRVLEIIFGIFTLCMAFLLFFQDNEKASQRKLPGFLGMMAAGGFIGLQSGLLGIGGGSFTVPFLTHRGVNIRLALVVSVSIAMTVAVIGSIAYMIAGFDASGLPQWSTGFVYWPAFLGLALGGILLAPYGAKVSRHISQEKVKILFVIFLLIVSAHMLWI